MKYFLLLFVLILAGCDSGKILKLDSQPSGAGVWRGETELLGHTPFVISGEKNESMELVLRNPGFKECAITVQLNPFQVNAHGKTAELTEDEKQSTALVPMEPLESRTYTLICRTSPDGAQVFLDGELKGNAPLEIKGLESKVWELVFKLKDRETVRRSIFLNGEEKFQFVNVKLPSTTVEFYRGKLKDEPAEILHYADLGHQLVLEGELEAAAETFKAGIKLMLEKKARGEGYRLWAEVERIIVVQYKYGDNNVISRARELTLAMLRELKEEYADIKDMDFHINYINCAASINRRQEAQEAFETAWAKWPNHKRLQPFIKQGFTP